MIHVCSLSRLPTTVDETGAQHVVTLLRDTSRVSLPKILRDNHLILSMDDIVAEQSGYSAPAQEHVTQLIEFVTRWDRGAPLVVHCFAGISRSTAGAFVAACALNPKRDEMQIAWEMRRASRTAMPNGRIVAFADNILGRDGRMTRAIETIGPGQFEHGAEEGVPFHIVLE